MHPNVQPATFNLQLPLNIHNCTACNCRLPYASKHATFNLQLPLNNHYCTAGNCRLPYASKHATCNIQLATPQNLNTPPLKKTLYPFTIPPVFLSDLGKYLKPFITTFSPRSITTSCGCFGFAPTDCDCQIVDS